MAVRKASAVWKGTLKEGNGVMSLGSGAFDGAYSFSTRFEEEPGTNPEELIGAAHAGCYSMFLSAVLTNNDFSPNSVDAKARVHLGRDETGPVISKIELTVEADVPGIDEEKFMEFAQIAKQNCPISRALAAVPEIVLDVTLTN